MLVQALVLRTSKKRFSDIIVTYNTFKSKLRGFDFLSPHMGTLYEKFYYLCIELNINNERTDTKIKTRG